MTAFVLRYDLRSPPWAATPHEALYRECLDQVAWADANGFDVVTLSEHHGVDDGFLPAPYVMAAAIGARTSRMLITIAASLAPLHDPVRLAEQIAVADLATGGRVSSVLGIGYVDREFAMAGVDRRGRGKLLEEYVGVMRQAWTGEPFTWRGREIRVTPVPVSKPHPPLLIGGSSEAAARRAARLGLGFLPAINDPSLARVYEEACAAAGTAGFCLLPTGPGFVHVTEDPDKAWAELAGYLWYDADTYRSWQTGDVRSQVATKARDLDELKREGIYRIVTPDECVVLAESLGPAGSLVLHPLLCGMPAALGWESIRLFRDAVMPRLRPGRT